MTKIEHQKLFSLEYQVPHKTLENPVCIGIFNNDGWGAVRAVEQADRLREILNKAEIRFSAVNREPPIEISIEEEDFSKLEALEPSDFEGIDKGLNPSQFPSFPIIVDSR